MPQIFSCRPPEGGCASHQLTALPADKTGFACLDESRPERLRSVASYGYIRHRLGGLGLGVQVRAKPFETLATSARMLAQSCQGSLGRLQPGRAPAPMKQQTEQWIKPRMKRLA